MRWIRPGLPELAGRLLLESLESACLGSGSERGWVLIRSGSRTLELVVSTAPAAPQKQRFKSGLPQGNARLGPDAARAFCPFHEAKAVLRFDLGSGALFLEGNSTPSLRVLESLQLGLERLESDREVKNLRRKVKRLGRQLKEAKRSGGRLLPELESTERRAGALSSWYRQAAEMLASAQLGSSLPALAEHAKNLLEVDFAAVLVKEVQRVRLWGGESLRKLLGNTFEVKKLGSIGRKLFEERKAYISSAPRARFEKSKIFSSINVQSLLAVPMLVDGRVMGALLLGSSEEQDFLPEEIDLARLMAYQTALFLENALLASGADVERVVARAVLDSMADGVFTLDWEKKITSFNPAAEAITGWKAEEALGRTCSEVLRGQYKCPGQKQALGCAENCPLLALLADQELMESGLTVEGTIRTKEGEQRYVNSSYSVVADRGDLLGAVVLFRDITEKKAFEQMKSDYAAALSHDLKTPLTAMKGYAVTLLRHGQKLNEEMRREALEVINSEIDRVTRMFDNLLLQARMEAGVDSRYLEPVTLADAVKRVVNLHGFATRRHRLGADVPDDLVVRTDRDQLDQILNNLVSNAVKYSPGGCEITVRATREDRFAHVEVEDTGSGIPEDQVPYVFERFRRVEDRMSRKVRGSGLGLYITRMLVEGLGGEVGVSSSEGEGSTFWFKLPLYRGRHSKVMTHPTEQADIRKYAKEI